MKISLHGVEHLSTVVNSTIPKVGQLDLVLDFYKLEHTAHFQRSLCIAPNTFDTLLSMIEDHDSFQTTNDLQPQQQQIPISSQLTITLSQGEGVDIQGLDRVWI